jgi:hypothetical protein
MATLKNTTIEKLKAAAQEANDTMLLGSDVMQRAYYRDQKEAIYRAITVLTNMPEQQFLRILEWDEMHGKPSKQPTLF